MIWLLGVLKRFRYEQSAESIIFNNGLKVSSFSIWDGPVKKNDYSLYPASILELYKGEKFSPERNFSRTCYYSDGESTYEKYRGTYAQDVKVRFPLSFIYCITFLCSSLLNGS